RQALEMDKRLLGQEHPDVATSLNNLAFLYQSQGRYAEAEPLYRQALEMRKRLLGQEHPDVATSLNNLAFLYQSQGQITRAIEFFSQGLAIEEGNLDTIIATGSERQKQDYMNTLSGTTYAAISFHLQTAPNNPQAAKLALTTLLRRKGRILDAVTDNLRTLRQNLTPENQQLLDDLTDTRSQLAALIFNKPEDLPVDQYKQQVSQLKGKANQLEAQLARTSSQFRTQTAPVTIETVQQLIPSDAALVEIVVYQPYDAKTDTFGEPHYAAYILNSTGNPQWVDLGETKPINQAVQAFKTALSNGTNQVQTTGRNLDQLLMQPIRAKLGNTQKLLLSPDGQLNLIPFAALVDENNQYLVQNYHITYLTTGRDLIRLTASSDSKNPPLIVADPDYDNPGQTRTATRSSNSRSTDIANLQFSDLPGTAAEAEAIQQLLPQATILTETEATENTIKQTPSPNILHIATHGFFLEDVEQVAPTPVNSSLTASNNRGLIVVRPRPGSSPRPQNTENPLLRSGLAMAGFNRKESGTEDGVLTALELASLNLYGTKLVVLSACETGVGSVNNGEGVYGLRRALAIAGSESQVMSLWNVSDEGTKDLMTQYYQRLQRGEGRSEALRQVQLGMLQSSKYSHPYYWSAFIPSGEWRPMDN
ncbi:CHAT domain-containing protein, partial [Spirulina sp. CS-785/01]|uniref:CHAT domain-containing tetratricopeptide repeat protein n=1 Tax=Spirulina sp. CS-785/01 TaxID=3021716 RepID=UPI00232CCCCD